MVVAVLTLLLFLACWLAFRYLANALLTRSGFSADWRDSVLLGSLMGGSAIVAITEALSLVSRLEARWLLTAWLTVLLATIAVFVSVQRGAGSVGAARADAPSKRVPAPDLSAVEISMLAVLVIQVTLLAVVALVYPPNNYDSMTYHMARIFHWEQQRSVALYPSGIMMQVRGAPFAEYAIAQPQLLLGRDWYANLIQWYAMVLSVIGVSIVAAEFGADRLRQIASAVLAASIPMGILQATSTQNDYVVAAWMTCFAVSALRFLKSSARSSLWAIAMGIALGLAILTKQTALAYAPAFCIYVAIVAVWRSRWRALGTGIAILGIIAIINSGFAVRSARLFGTPLGPSAGLANEQRSAAVTVSNAIRNVAINVANSGGVVGLDALSKGLLDGLAAAHIFTGLDPVDPRTTLTTAEDPFALRSVMHEDLSGNFVHLLLTTVAILACLLSFLKRTLSGRALTPKAYKPEVFAYTACVIVAFIFLCYYFKWQVWNTRLQLALFVLASPIVGTVLFASSRRILVSITLVVALLGFPYTFGNVTRPLNISAVVGKNDRTEQYFANRPDLWPVFGALTEAISQTSCRKIGLRISRDPFEYPLWVLLRNRGIGPTIKHVESHALTPVPLDPEFRPCAIVSAEAHPQHSAAATRKFGGFYLYLVSEAGPASGNGS